MFLSGDDIIGGYERDLYGIKAGHGTCYCFTGKCFCEHDEQKGEENVFFISFFNSLIGKVSGKRGEDPRAVY